MNASSDQFQQAIERFDAANRDDPNRETFEGKEYPKELLYAERMSKWLGRIAPEASEALRLAARAQHICRWKIPRTDFSEDRTGYLRWRTELSKFHAETVGKILTDVGYDAATIERVRQLLRKKALKKDPETQTLEDVICLVFLEGYFTDFARKHDEGKLINIIQKTWAKMSARGQEVALQLDLSPDDRALIEKALST